MRRRAGKNRFERALTLIEMLVVMAIILMLAAITHRVVMRAMKKAEDVEEVSDTRQGNINEFIKAIEEGKSYDELPDNIKEGRFHESQ
jgi:prepilin-type N-terminal cleavage/methylation domain-containing protein